jgi:predicted nucleic acid-binding protein
VDFSVAETFGMIKSHLEFQGTPLDDFDLVIAASALANNLILVTNNEKHFRRVEGLELDNWNRS